MGNTGTTLAACGNDCSACPRYLATVNESEAQLTRVASLWHHLGWRDSVASASEIRCTGCTPSNPCRHGIAGCATEQRTETCGECLRYGACDRLAEAILRTEAASRQCSELVDEGTYAVLRRAFFKKRVNLEARHKNRTGV